MIACFCSLSFSESCPAGAYQNGNSCYYFSDDDATWPGAMVGITVSSSESSHYKTFEHRINQLLLSNTRFLYIRKDSGSGTITGCSQPKVPRRG